MVASDMGGYVVDMIGDIEGSGCYRGARRRTKCGMCSSALITDR